MSFLGQLFSGTHAAVSFAQASARMREVECELRDEALSLGDHPKTIRFPHLELPTQDYWERNFFSILFVSIFDAVGIAPERIRHYAAIVQLVRGIVTATDNILDNENKGAMRVELAKGHVLSNTLCMLMQSALMIRRVRAVAPDPEGEARTWGALIDKLYAIGEEESGEEEAVEDVLSPEALLDTIHRFRGANLLLLAFVAPELNEPALADAIDLAKQGVFRIGMALQILDDLADFEEDLRRRNHNILRSWLVHGRGKDAAGRPAAPVSDAALSALSVADQKAPERVFPEATGEVMVLAIELCLSGFDRLTEAGHPLNRETARELIGAMFRLRKLPHLWNLYLESAKLVDVATLEPLMEVLADP